MSTAAHRSGRARGARQTTRQGAASRGRRPLPHPANRLVHEYFGLRSDIEALRREIRETLARRAEARGEINGVNP